MKIICKVSEKIELKGFHLFKVIVEVAAGKMAEAIVGPGQYSSSKEVEIKSSGITFYPKSLLVDSSRCHAAELLLNLEICKFVSENFPELKLLDFDSEKDKFIGDATKIGLSK